MEKQAKKIYLAFFVALAISMAAITTTPAQTDVTLSVIPAAISLASGEGAQVLVLASLPDGRVERAQLSAFDLSGIDFTIQSESTASIPLLGDLIWTVMVKRTATTRPTGQLYFRLDYDHRQSNDQVIRRVKTAVLDVQDRSPDPIDKVVSARIETALDTIQDRQSRQVFVVVKNISNVPVTVSSIHVQPLPNMNVSEPELKGSVVIAPQEAQPFALTITAENRVQTGKYLLVVTVEVSFEQAAQRTEGSLVLSHPFQAGVFAESAILQATGIPSLLLLPGFLLLTCLILITQWSWKKKLLELDFKKAEFWFLAITISFLMILLYPEITYPYLSWLARLMRSPHPSNDLLQGYGFNDIMILWFGSALLGILVWGLGSSVVWIRAQIRRAIQRAREEKDRQRRAKFVPAETDGPIETLTKIMNHGQNLSLTQVEYSEESRQQVVFRLPALYDEPGKVWVVPRIQLSWIKTGYEDELDKLTSNPNKIAALTEKLKEWQDTTNAVASLDWETGTLIKGPTLVDEVQTKEIDSFYDTFFLAID